MLFAMLFPAIILTDSHPAHTAWPSTGLVESENLYPLFYLSDIFLPYTDITYYKRARFPDNVIKLR